MTEKTEIDYLKDENTKLYWENVEQRQVIDSLELELAVLEERLNLRDIFRLWLLKILKLNSSLKD